MATVDTVLLHRIVPGFEQFIKTEEGRILVEERRAKDEFFAQHFNEHSLEELEEGTLRELIHILWAFNGWTNKDWLWGEMLQSGLPKIKSTFRRLLYGDELLEKRFDAAKSNIRMLGAAAISEIMAHVDHEKYPIWNARSRRGLVNLGIDEALLPKSAQISGAQYVQFQGLTRAVLQQVARHYPAFKDLLDLDALLYYTSLQDLGSLDYPSTTIVEAAKSQDFDHREVIEHLLELGDGLGFEVAHEVSVLPGCRIDVVWRSRVANLGILSYAFEVHRRGNRDSAVLNLQRVSSDPTIQKVVVVSNRDEIERFKEIIASLPEAFRNAVGYFEVADLERALEHLQSLKGILNTLGLLSTTSILD